jgi:hypothetical protein
MTSPGAARVVLPQAMGPKGGIGARVPCTWRGSRHGGGVRPGIRIFGCEPRLRALAQRYSAAALIRLASPRTFVVGASA